MSSTANERRSQSEAEELSILAAVLADDVRTLILATHGEKLVAGLATEAARQITAKLVEQDLVDKIRFETERRLTEMVRHDAQAEKEEIEAIIRTRLETVESYFIAIRDKYLVKMSDELAAARTAQAAVESSLMAVRDEMATDSGQALAELEVIRQRLGGIQKRFSDELAAIRGEQNRLARLEDLRPEFDRLLARLENLGPRFDKIESYICDEQRTTQAKMTEAPPGRVGGYNQSVPPPRSVRPIKLRPDADLTPFVHRWRVSIAVVAAVLFIVVLIMAVKRRRAPAPVAQPAVLRIPDMSTTLAPNAVPDMQEQPSELDR